MRKTKRGGLWNPLGNEGVRPANKGLGGESWFYKGNRPGEGIGFAWYNAQRLLGANECILIQWIQQAHLNSDQRTGTPGSVRNSLGYR